MNLKPLALTLCALCACAPSGLPVYFLEEPSEELVRETEQILGFELVDVGASESSLIIELRDEPTGGLYGKFTSPEHCFSLIWSVKNPRILAHELGHAFGLSHDEDESNLMSESWYGTELRASQRERLERFAEARWDKCHS